MNIQTVMKQLSKMFPNIDIARAFQTAQNETNGVPDTLEGVQAVVKRMGVKPEAVEQIYSNYGNTAAGRAVCAMLGTTPEALKKDAETLVGGKTSVDSVGQKWTGLDKSQYTTPQKTAKFPRLG